MNSKLLKAGESRPITEQAGRMGAANGNLTQRAPTDINEYFMPKKRI